jgi:uncharacterized phage infection (PIP) family protein YhgE
MRRWIFLVLGMLELTCAMVLVVFAWQLPGPADVHQAAERIDRVGHNAGRQVRSLRAQCQRLRQRQPELLAMSRNLEKQMRSISETVRARSLDADGLATITAALGEVAEGLDGMATALDPRGVAQMSKGFGATASYLEDKVVPTAEKIASSLDKATVGLKADSGKLGKVLGEAPIELKAARAMLKGLAEFESGLKRMNELAGSNNFEAMREGFKGMEISLDTGASQIEKMARSTIPKVTVKGLKLEIEEKQLWPEAREVADGMRKAAKGCQAAGKEMEAFNKELPRFRTSLEQSHKVIRTTRQALSTTLEQQERIEPVLNRLPKNLARLTDELPQLITELTKVLRETARLREIATALRQAEKTIDHASSRWPELRTSLGKSAELLRGTQKQLQAVLGQRSDYESLFRQTVILSATFAESLPSLVQQVEDGLSQQEESLGDLDDSIEQVRESVPTMARSASRILITTRVLLGLVALMVGLHAGYVLAGTWTPKRSAGSS